MLQRAASNAYSWWWASHIRTKQSKWLEQNLQDMEEKVNNTIQIIDEDGDTFAQRAEMYYRKRPELLNFVEELYRSYRALAERYDHLSRELQSANRTIASVFPERVQLSMDEEDEENLAQTSKDTLAVPKTGIPKVPKIPKKDFRSSSMVMTRKKQLNRIASTTKATSPPRSGLSKSEALEEIDRHQKEILALQTETEFVKSSYENAYAKYWEIENQITEMQQKVCSLQDEFGIGTVIDDNEARTLMATTALNSCQETLERLQETHQHSAEEAKIDHQRIKEAQEKFAALKNKFLSGQTDQHDPNAGHEFVSEDLELINMDQQEKHDLELLREKIEKQLDVNSNTPLTVSQLAEKVDELVGKVVTLETAVSSQTALVKRLRSETDELLAHIRSLEEKDDLIESSDTMRNRIKAMEEELCRVKALNQSVKDQNKNLLTQFTEASCNIDHFIQKLQKAKLEEEVEDLRLFQEVKTVPDDKSDKGVEEHEDKLAPGDTSGISEDKQREQEDTKDVLSNSVKAEGDNYIESGPTDMSTQEEKDEKKDLSETTDIKLDDEIEEMGTEEEGEQPNWGLMLINGLEDRETILLDEYSSVLRNYKEVKMKLGEVEKKNRDGFFELALQIRELKNAVFQRDEEIQSLRQKMSSPQNNPDETLTEYKYSNQEGVPESINLAASSLDSTVSSPISHQQTVSGSLGDEIKAKHADKPREIVTIEEKVRSDIDELLEENLEFWLRFSTSVHQIKKFQTSVRDLKAELLKLKDRMKQEGGGKQQSLNSDGRPIYKHMREIQTELTLWLENNAILKEELQGRYSSLSNIQQEISRVSNAGSKAGDELSEYQAAKFQGEILNMKQENNKIADELQAGLDRVRVLKAEVEKILAILDEDLGISASRTPNTSSSSRPRIPLRSFLFGVKLKKQKQQKQQKAPLLSCINPALQKQHSDLTAAAPLPQ